MGDTPQARLDKLDALLKGHASAEPKAATERARLLIEQAEALGEPPEDPLLLFSVLYSSGLRALWRSKAMRCANFLRNS
jgi:hypothetical protein